MRFVTQIANVVGYGYGTAIAVLAFAPQMTRFTHLFASLFDVITAAKVIFFKSIKIFQKSTKEQRETTIVASRSFYFQLSTFNYFFAPRFFDAFAGSAMMSMQS